MIDQINQFAKKVRLTFYLLVFRKYRYRVEIDKYYPESGDATFLSLKFFQLFPDAQNYVKTYRKPFYKIAIYEQRGNNSYLSNIETGVWATTSDLKRIQYVKDRYGFTDVIGPDTNGWSLRGLNTHDPQFVEVTEDLDYLLMETKRRILEGSQFGSLKRVIAQLFEERHPHVEDHFKHTFEELFMIRMSMQ